MSMLTRFKDHGPRVREEDLTTVCGSTDEQILKLELRLAQLERLEA